MAILDDVNHHMFVTDGSPLETKAVIVLALKNYLMVPTSDGGAGLFTQQQLDEVVGDGDDGVDDGQVMENFVDKIFPLKMDPNDKTKNAARFEASFAGWTSSILYSKTFIEKLKEIIFKSYFPNGPSWSDLKLAFTAANNEYKANNKIADASKPQQKVLKGLMDRISKLSTPPPQAALHVTPRMGYSTEDKEYIVAQNYGGMHGLDDETLLKVFKPGLPSLFGPPPNPAHGNNPSKFLFAESSMVRRPPGPDSSDDSSDDSEDDDPDMIEIPHAFARVIEGIEQQLLRPGEKVTAEGVPAIAFFVQQLLSVSRRAKGDLKGAVTLTGNAKYDLWHNLIKGVHLWMQSPTLCPVGKFDLIKDLQTRQS